MLADECCARMVFGDFKIGRSKPKLPTTRLNACQINPREVHVLHIVCSYYLHTYIVLLQIHPNTHVLLILVQGTPSNPGSHWHRNVSSPSTHNPFSPHGPTIFPATSSSNDEPGKIQSLMPGRKHTLTHNTNIN